MFDFLKIQVFGAVLKGVGWREEFISLHDMIEIFFLIFKTALQEFLIFLCASLLVENGKYDLVGYL